MKTLSLAAVSVLLSLSGCAHELGYYRGVGFTGIDGEPSSIAEADALNGVVARAQSSSAALAGLPPVALQSDGTTLDDLARVAVDNGGRTPSTAIPVRQSGYDRMLSTVQVNGILFAVLLLPQGSTGRMESGAGASFAGSIERLTGCLPGGPAYAKGGADAPKGLAVPMDCS